MEPVEVIEGRVAVLDRSDVDTDQIIPKQFLKRVERTGFGEFLFYEAIIAPSYSDIFYSNCTKNGLLPIVLDEKHCRAVAAAGEARIDLDDQTVNVAGGVFQFEIDEEIKHRLLNGLDDVAMTLGQVDAIDAFEASGRAARGVVTTEL